MKLIKLTVGQAIVKFIDNQYVWFDGEESKFVEGIFNIFGHGNVLGLGIAMEETEHDLKIIQGKNEQGMAHSAIAFAKEKLRRKIFAVTTSIGPGSTNLVTSAATAFVNNLPVLFFVGETFSSRQPDPVLQQIEVESSNLITVNDCLKPVSRYFDRIYQPQQLMSALIRAFEVLTDQKSQGPATICLPQDVANKYFEFEESFFKKRIHYMKRIIPDEYEIDRFSNLLLNSKRPVITLGGGVKYSEANQIVQTISEKYNIPIVETQAGKSAIPFNFKNLLGGVGVTGNEIANEAVYKSDLVINLGTRLTDFTTNSKKSFSNVNVEVVNVNINRFQSMKIDGFSVVGDIKLTLEKLLAKLPNYKSTYNDEIIEWKKTWAIEIERIKNISEKTNELIEIKNQFSDEKIKQYSQTLNTNLSQSQIIVRLNEILPENSIIVGAAGSLPGDLQRLFEPKYKNNYHMEYGYSCMGYEIAAALGVKIANPDKEVYAFVGDGSFLMMHTELVTALQYHYKINIVLFDNSGYGCINNLQMDNGGKSFCTELLDCNNEIMNIDYAKIGEGYGMRTFKINKIDNLESVISSALKYSISTLIEIKVLPKTMSKNYGGWWHVGVPETSINSEVSVANKKIKDELEKIRKY
ncbi:3D-(3,5/4)-trihydroxycyclohexane-1,2-dione acylhydrolase (decyclizing) [Spiroplasma alleghenense]|uniref:Acetolactate synthase I/II/III large subunit n=1 Tax=Spiroplasma alleghenense TaxID=216931 RepID=A0A345Z3G3_9MOLU|nr:3D-(3,5/4)-trihydroxycyclohexane-1,2-dione acylhydrolase (decyclizing) [Spiroplasma alleghenense]AXK51142.1 acetolactate synthase I/II/III large subunit [Spiroplasma alleghenense]